jgi:hypothetical protein
MGETYRSVKRFVEQVLRHSSQCHKVGKEQGAPGLQLSALASAGQSGQAGASASDVAVRQKKTRLRAT